MQKRRVVVTGVGLITALGTGTEETWKALCEGRSGIATITRFDATQFSTRIAVLSLFGMMNWIYTWHHPRVDADADALAREMGNIFLRGVAGDTSR